MFKSGLICVKCVGHEHEFFDKKLSFQCDGYRFVFRGMAGLMKSAGMGCKKMDENNVRGFIVLF